MAFILHVLTIGRPQFRRPGQGRAVAGVRGACCLAHADRRAPRAACSTLRAADPQGSPNTQQTSRSFLQTQHPVARLAAGHSPGARSALSAAKVHTRSTLPVLSRPARTPLLATPPSRPQAGCGPAQDFEPRPLHNPHKSPEPWHSHPQPPVPAAAASFTCSREGLHLRAGARRWAGARSHRGHSGSSGLSRSPSSRREVSETKARLGELLPFPPSPASLKHSHTESSAL
nr:uncharacterized protein LOC120364950 [Saimiri boliviensis boliviensis]